MLMTLCVVEGPGTQRYRRTRSKGILVVCNEKRHRLIEPCAVSNYHFEESIDLCTVTTCANTQMFKVLHVCNTRQSLMI